MPSFLAQTYHADASIESEQEGVRTELEILASSAAHIYDSRTPREGLKKFFDRGSHPRGSCGTEVFANGIVYAVHMITFKQRCWANEILVLSII